MKSKMTVKLEYLIYKEFHKQGVYACHNVTIGRGDSEHIDMLTLDTKGIWRCFAIKVLRQDFYNKRNDVFVGNFNYYVMTPELFKIVEKDIPDDMGVYLLGYQEKSLFLAKRPKRRELGINEYILKDSLIRSLYRQSNKYVNNLFVQQQKNKLLKNSKKEKIKK